MAGYRLSPAAREDLSQIREYIARDDAEAADRLINQIADRFLMLARQPLIGSPREDVLRGLRDFTVGNYVIFYRATGKARFTVEIIRVLHCARDVYRLVRGNNLEG